MSSAQAATFTVTNTNDAGAGSLRQAMIDANTNPGPDLINFAIPGTGPHTITLTSALPVLTAANGSDTTIDGETQPGASCVAGVLQIYLQNGRFNSRAPNFMVRGLGMGGGDNGIRFDLGSDGSEVTCSRIGTNLDGVSANGYSVRGIQVRSDNVTIGGTNGTSPGGACTGDCNLISGNRQGISIAASANDTFVYGNYIGTTLSGTSGLGNTQFGINSTGEGTIIGTGLSAGRNIISGNAQDGIRIRGNNAAAGNGRGDNAVIRGNYIGLGSDGVTRIANNQDGIRTQRTTNLTIGGPLAGDGNVISGNSLSGILVREGHDMLIQNNIIGLDATASTARGNASHGIMFGDQGGSTSGVVDADILDNIIDDNNFGIYFDDPAGIGGLDNVSVLRNRIGTNVAGNSYGIVAAQPAVDSRTGDGTAANGNIITNNANHGIVVTSAVTGLPILGNSIFNNGSIGIDLSQNNSDTGDGLSLNDAGDGDGGGNNRLNYPVINGLVADGSTTVEFDIDADVPAGTYRVEFFLNSSLDPTGHGEGEIFLGAATITGPVVGGTGSFTASQSVGVFDAALITATLTEDTGSFGDTSEFSKNASVLDFSDAPAVFGSASHTVSSGLLIGSGVTADLTDYFDANAAADVDDGVGALPTLVPSVTSTITVSVTGGGNLQAFIDWDGAGGFGAGEQVALDLTDGGALDTNPTVGVISFEVTPPASAVTGQSFLRLRWASASGIGPTGFAADGEVEDYAIVIDAPNPSMTINKVADDDTDVALGQVITYTYTVTNTGNVALSDITLSDVHGGTGTAPVPDPDTATLTDNGVSGDSGNPITGDNDWDLLAPGDVLTVTATYTVTQGDIDTLQ